MKELLDKKIASFVRVYKRSNVFYLPRLITILGKRLQYCNALYSIQFEILLLDTSLSHIINRETNRNNISSFGFANNNTAGLRGYKTLYNT